MAVSALMAAAFVFATAPGPAVASAGSRLRAPTAYERHAIAKSLREEWNYESRTSRAYRPILVKVRVRRARPAYASAVVALRGRSGDWRGPWMVALSRHVDSWWVVAGPAVDFPLW